MIATTATVPNRPTNSVLDQPLRRHVGASCFAETLTAVRPARWYAQPISSPARAGRRVSS